MVAGGYDWGKRALSTGGLRGGLLGSCEAKYQTEGEPLQERIGVKRGTLKEGGAGEVEEFVLNRCPDRLSEGTGENDVFKGFGCTDVKFSEAEGAGPSGMVAAGAGARPNSYVVGIMHHVE